MFAKGDRKLAPPAEPPLLIVQRASDVASAEDTEGLAAPLAGRESCGRIGRPDERRRATGRLSSHVAVPYPPPRCSAPPAAPPQLYSTRDNVSGR